MSRREREGSGERLPHPTHYHRRRQGRTLSYAVED